MYESRHRDPLAILHPVVIVALLCSTFAALMPATAVRAATFTITSTADVIANDGVCTLREAIIATNTQAASGAAAGECPAGTGADTITLPAGTYTLTIRGEHEDNAATGDLDIKSNLTIQGEDYSTTIIQASATSPGNAIDRVLDIFAGSVVSVSNVTIRNGNNPFDGLGAGGIRTNGNTTLSNCRITSNRANYAGGGILNGGGPFGPGNQGHLTLIDTIIDGNTAGEDGGGGIYNPIGSMLTLSNTTVTSNKVTGFGGDGGGIYNNGRASISHGTITGNIVDHISGFAGGGIYSISTIAVSDTNISNNSAYSGGGTYVAGSATVMNTTIAGNTADGTGGIAVSGDSGTVVQMTNSTLSGNISTNPSPIGTFAAVSVSSGDAATLTNTTIAGNTRGIVVISGGSLTLKNSIVADSADENCKGTVTSGDYNLDSSTTCGLNMVHDQSNANPLLDALHVNAPGITATHALLPGSPAIDHGGTSANGCPSTDQRGVARPIGNACDTGAYEAPYPYTPPSRNTGFPPPNTPPNPQPPLRNQPVVPPSDPVLPAPPSRP
jgi:hypothetical protein